MVVLVVVIERKAVVAGPFALAVVVEVVVEVVLKVKVKVEVEVVVEVKLRHS